MTVTNICQVVEDMYVYKTFTYEEIPPSTYENQPVEKGRYFQRNASLVELASVVFR